jgi:hypothetical protein
MLGAATPKGILDTIGWLLVSLCIGALIVKLAKTFGAPLELRLPAFAFLTGVTLAIWQVGRRFEAKADRG